MTITAHPTIVVRRQILLLLGVFMIGVNLRPALTSVAPLLSVIGSDLNMGPIGQGVLTTLPVLCLGLSAPTAPVFARRFGIEKTVFAVLLLLTLVLWGRPYFSMGLLFAGTMLAGGCIGIMGVLLPGLVKRDFPQHVGLMTGLYTLALCVGAALAAGISEPLRMALRASWSHALAFWMLPALLAGILWLPQLRSSSRPQQRSLLAAPGSLYKDRLAWEVTLFMGLQSSLAYIVFGWLPTVLVARGLSPVAAGWAMSVSVFIQGVAAIAVPIFATRLRHQQLVILAVMVTALLGLAGCFFFPLQGLWLWVTVLGIGQGGAFSMALTLLALRAADSDTANRLSSMAQGIGYVLAAMGPLVVGFLYARTNGFASSGVLILVVGSVATFMGFRAGRDAYVLQGK